MTTDERGPELHYVIRTVDGARHAGWYRLTKEHELQVVSEGHCVTVPAAPGSLEDQAREVLKAIAMESEAAKAAAAAERHDDAAPGVS